MDAVSKDLSQAFEQTQPTLVTASPVPPTPTPNSVPATPTPSTIPGSHRASRPSSPASSECRGPPKPVKKEKPRAPSKPPSRAADSGDEPVTRLQCHACHIHDRSKSYMALAGLSLAALDQDSTLRLLEQLDREDAESEAALLQKEAEALASKQAEIRKRLAQLNLNQTKPNGASSSHEPMNRNARPAESESSSADDDDDTAASAPDGNPTHDTLGLGIVRDPKTGKAPEIS